MASVSADSRIPQVDGMPNPELFQSGKSCRGDNSLVTELQQQHSVGAQHYSERKKLSAVQIAVSCGELGELCSGVWK
jgi:hypothetical protein